MKGGLTRAELAAFKAWFEKTYPDTAFVLHPAFVQQWRSSLLTVAGKGKL